MPAPFPDGGTLTSGEAQHAFEEAKSEGRLIIRDRLFISEQLSKSNVLEEWDALVTTGNAIEFFHKMNALHEMLVRIAHEDLGMSENRTSRVPNLKKGLNRLLLVTMAVWLIAGFLFTYNSVSNTRKFACVEAEALDARLDQYARAYRDLPDFIPVQPIVAKQPLKSQGVVVEGPDGKEYLFPVATEKADAVAVFKQQRSSQQWCQTAKPITAALRFALIPPVIVYVLFQFLFASVLWISRGFSGK
jgi:hypothetical protein